jgi:hypothetical protein
MKKDLEKENKLFSLYFVMLVLCLFNDVVVGADTVP